MTISGLYYVYENVSKIDFVSLKNWESGDKGRKKTDAMQIYFAFSWLYFNNIVYVNEIFLGESSDDCFLQNLLIHLPQILRKSQYAQVCSIPVCSKGIAGSKISSTLYNRRCLNSGFNSRKSSILCLL